MLATACSSTARPLLERLGGNRQGSTFGGASYEPEQHSGAGLVQRHQTDLINEDQVKVQHRVDDLIDGEVGKTA